MKSINLSKKKKQEIMETVEKLREFLTEQTDNKSLLGYIDAVERYIKKSSYGLVFEKHLEDHDANLNKQEAELRELKENKIQKENSFHILIEGENLTALKLLKDDYAQKIDLICVDPPYNTGNPTLKYNDTDYVDSDDFYSHSKWLSFMDKRLRAANKLLSNNGVIFIHIDETQIGGLILLCHQIFGEENVDVLIWSKTDPKYDMNRVEKPIYNVKIVHEYVVLCYKNKNCTSFKQMMRRPNHSPFSIPEEKFTMESILNELGTTSSAKDEMKAIFDSRNAFSTPKPTKMIKEFIRVATNKNSIVMDFFAGSGTTGHAVMDLNQEDSGTRKCILITNNENNICRKITYKRLKHVIDVNNYNEGWKYFQIKEQPNKDYYPKKL